MAEYRHSEHGPPAMIQDLFSILDWIKNTLIVEPILGVGRSYGGLQALNQARDQFDLVLDRMAAGDLGPGEAQVLQSAARNLETAFRGLGVDLEDPDSMGDALMRGLMDVVDIVDVALAVPTGGLSLAVGPLARRGLRVPRRPHAPGARPARLTPPKSAMDLESSLGALLERARGVRGAEGVVSSLERLRGQIPMVVRIEKARHASPGVGRKKLRLVSGPIEEEMGRQRQVLLGIKDYRQALEAPPPAWVAPQFPGGGLGTGKRLRPELGDVEAHRKFIQRLREHAEQAKGTAVTQGAQKENLLLGQRAELYRERAGAFDLEESRLPFLSRHDPQVRRQMMEELNLSGVAGYNYEWDEAFDEILQEYVRFNNALAEEQSSLWRRIGQSDNPSQRAFLAEQYRDIGDYNTLASGRYWGGLEHASADLVARRGHRTVKLLEESLGKPIEQLKQESDLFLAQLSDERLQRIFLPEGIEQGSAEARRYFLEQALSDFPSRSLLGHQEGIRTALQQGYRSPGDISMRQLEETIARSQAGTAQPYEGSFLLMFDKPLSEVTGPLTAGGSADALRIQGAVKDYIRETVEGRFTQGQRLDKSLSEIFGVPEVGRSGRLWDLFRPMTIDPQTVGGRSILGVESGLVDPFGRQLVPGAEGMKGLDIPAGASPRQAQEAYEIYARIVYREQFQLAQRLNQLRALGVERWVVMRKMEAASLEENALKWARLQGFEGGREIRETREGIERMENRIRDLDRRALQQRREYAALFHRLEHKPLGEETLAKRGRTAYEAVGEFWRTGKVPPQVRKDMLQAGLWKQADEEDIGYTWIGGGVLEGNTGRLGSVEELYPFSRAGQDRRIDPFFAQEHHLGNLDLDAGGEMGIEQELVPSLVMGTLPARRKSVRAGEAQPVLVGDERAGYLDYLERMLVSGQLEVGQLLRGEGPLVPEGFTALTPGMTSALKEMRGMLDNLRTSGPFYRSFGAEMEEHMLRGGAGRPGHSEEWRHFLESIEGGQAMFDPSWTPAAASDPDDYFGAPIPGRGRVAGELPPAAHRTVPPAYRPPDIPATMGAPSASRYRGPRVASRMGSLVYHGRRRPATGQTQEQLGAEMAQGVESELWGSWRRGLLEEWNRVEEMSPLRFPHKGEYQGMLQEGVLGRLVRRAQEDEQYQAKLGILHLAREEGLIGRGNVLRGEEDPVTGGVLRQMHKGGMIDDRFLGRGTLFTEAEASRYAAFRKRGEESFPSQIEYEQAARQWDDFMARWRMTRGGAFAVNNYISHGLSYVPRLYDQLLGEHRVGRLGLSGYTPPVGQETGNLFQRAGAGLNLLGRAGTRLDRSAWTGVGLGYLGVKMAEDHLGVSSEGVFPQSRDFREKHWMEKQGQWLLPQGIKDRAFLEEIIGDVARGGNVATGVGEALSWMDTLVRGAPNTLLAMLGVPNIRMPVENAPEVESDIAQLMGVEDVQGLSKEDVQGLYGQFMQGGASLELLRKLLGESGGSEEVVDALSRSAGGIARSVGSYAGMGLPFAAGDVANVPTRFLRPEIVEKQSMAEIYRWLQKPYGEGSREVESSFAGMPGRAFPTDALQPWQSRRRVSPEFSGVFPLGTESQTEGVPRGVDVGGLFEMRYGSNRTLSDLVLNRKRIVSLVRRLAELDPGTDAYTEAVTQRDRALELDEELRSAWGPMLEDYAIESEAHAQTLVEAESMRGGMVGGDQDYLASRAGMARNLAEVVRDRMLESISQAESALMNLPGSPSESRLKQLQVLRTRYGEVQRLFQDLLSKIDSGSEVPDLERLFEMGASFWQPPEDYSLMGSMGPDPGAGMGEQLVGRRTLFGASQEPGRSVDLSPGWWRPKEGQRLYDRSEYMRGGGWDKVRQQVLDRYRGPDGKIWGVYSGQWLPESEVQLEHILPASMYDFVARTHRGRGPVDDAGREFFHDPDNLIPVQGDLNVERAAQLYGRGGFRPPETRVQAALANQFSRMWQRHLGEFAVPEMAGMTGTGMTLAPGGGVVTVAPSGTGGGPVLELLRQIRDELQGLSGRSTGGSKLHSDAELSAIAGGLFSRPEFPQFREEYGRRNPFSLLWEDDDLRRVRPFASWLERRRGREESEAEKLEEARQEAVSYLELTQAGMHLQPDRRKASALGLPASVTAAAGREIASRGVEGVQGIAGLPQGIPEGSWLDSVMDLYGIQDNVMMGAKELEKILDSNARMIREAEKASSIVVGALKQGLLYSKSIEEVWSYIFLELFESYGQKWLIKFADWASSLVIGSIFGNLQGPGPGLAGADAVSLPSPDPGFSGVFGPAPPGRAMGGAAPVKMPFLAGEQGPELVVAGGPAHVVPADRTRRLLGGGPAEVKIEYHINIESTDGPGVRAALAEALPTFTDHAKRETYALVSRDRRRPSRL